jgi:hypothetical protein
LRVTYYKKAGLLGLFLVFFSLRYIILQCAQLCSCSCTVPPIVVPQVLYPCKEYLLLCVLEIQSWLGILGSTNWHLFYVSPGQVTHVSLCLHLWSVILSLSVLSVQRLRSSLWFINHSNHLFQ